MSALPKAPVSPKRSPAEESRASSSRAAPENGLPRFLQSANASPTRASLEIALACGRLLRAGGFVPRAVRAMARGWLTSRIDGSLAIEIADEITERSRSIRETMARTSVLEAHALATRLEERDNLESLLVSLGIAAGASDEIQSEESRARAALVSLDAFAEKLEGELRGIGGSSLVESWLVSLARGGGEGWWCRLVGLQEESMPS